MNNNNYKDCKTTTWARMNGQGCDFTHINVSPEVDQNDNGLLFTVSVQFVLVNTVYLGFTCNRV